MQLVRLLLIKPLTTTTEQHCSHSTAAPGLRGPARGEGHSPLQIPAHLTVTRGGKKYLYIKFDIFNKITGLSPKDLPSPFLYSATAKWNTVELISAEKLIEQ